jgi:hypothetical protein
VWRGVRLAVALVVFAAPSAAIATPPARASATCSDYPNQAAAQRAADTRDPDGDGVYCEDLPCPCLKPGRRHSHHQPPPALFHGACKRGRLPDRHCTPGRSFRGVTADKVCTPGYSAKVRNVSETTKRRVYRRYGIRRHHTGQYEVDHLIPLELGGSNSIKNLFAEAARPRPGFHQKDRLENRLHDEVCDGTLELRTAQHRIASNWLKAYRREFG